MNMKDAVVSVLTNWNNYSDRACRSEFWYFILAVFLVAVIIGIIEIETGMVDIESDGIGILSIIYLLLISPPSISVTARRLHDRGWSGWWQLPALLIGYFPYVLILSGWSVSCWSDWSDSCWSEWWGYLSWVPFLLIVVLNILPATEDENKWGRNPLT